MDNLSQQPPHPHAYKLNLGETTYENSSRGSRPATQEVSQPIPEGAGEGVKIDAARLRDQFVAYFEFGGSQGLQGGYEQLCQMLRAHNPDGVEGIEEVDRAVTYLL